MGKVRRGEEKKGRGKRGVKLCIERSGVNAVRKSQRVRLKGTLRLSSCKLFDLERVSCYCLYITVSV